jgi:diguanylate cyclase (GGDEF)-like protein
MIDLRTLLLLLMVADLVFAAALALAGGRPLREGLGEWTASLLVRAIACGVVALTGPAPGALAVGSAFFALAITLQVAALLALDRKHLETWLYGLVVATVAVPMALLESEPANAAVFGALLLGTLFAAAAAIAGHLAALRHTRARPVLLASWLVAAYAFLQRGFGAAFSADGILAFQAPTGFASIEWLAVFAAAVAGTLAFLMLHQERAEAEVRRLSMMDALTGAYNRSTFHEVAERELARAKRAAQPLSMVLFDIDHFGAINEKHGHLAGDEVLARFAERVRSALRQEDMLVRFGGEAFLVLLPDVPGPGAVVVAGRIRRRVAESALQAAGREFDLTVSLGVSALLDEGPESVETLLERAGSALALAKQRGRNRVVALSLGRSIAA